MTLLLVDGPNIAMRALHAARGTEMSSSDGTATGALVIFINILTRHIREEQPTHIVVVWEGFGGSDRRREAIPEYKANRAPVDEGLQDDTFTRIIEFLTCCGIPSSSRNGYEADDVIGAYWAHATRHHVDDIVILTGDKDMLQLVGPNPCRVPTTVVRPGSIRESTDRWDAIRVEEHYGVPPAALPALLAVWGDTVDGIEGVPGIGPKRGAKLLRAHGWSLDKAFPAGHEHRERVLTNHQAIDLRSLDLYEMPPPRFITPVEGSGCWESLINFCDRYDMINIKERILTGRLWAPGQDRPVGRQLRARPAQTTAGPVAATAQLQLDTTGE